MFVKLVETVFYVLLSASMLLVSYRSGALYSIRTSKEVSTMETVGFTVMAFLEVIIYAGLAFMLTKAFVSLAFATSIGVVIGIYFMAKLIRFLFDEIINNS